MRGFTLNNACSLVVANALIPTPGNAQEDLQAIYGPLLAQCYSAAGDFAEQRQCIGVMSDACMEQQDGGQSTQGMAGCMYGEAEAWDRLLNQEYQLTMAWARDLDRDEAELFPEYAVRAKTLRDAQRAWIPFRDAECAFDYSIWGSGSLRQIYGSSCILQMTADRAIELHSKRETNQ